MSPVIFKSEIVSLRYAGVLSSFLLEAAEAVKPAEFSQQFFVGEWPQSLSFIQKSETDTIVFNIAQDIQREGGTLYIVGGWVRDKIFQRENKDIDTEIFGLSSKQLQNILGQYGIVDCVGEQFGVFMVHGIDIDFALPRRESKAGRGHRGFDIACDANLSLEEAARRRDLTMNALYYNPLTEEIIDPFHAQEDMRRGRLRCCDKMRFADDPLRALRAVRFAATYGFLPDAELIDLMREQDLSELSKDRIYQEWERIARRSIWPSIALLVLADSDLGRYFPLLEDMRYCPQNPLWHPEGSVYVHTALVLDQAVQQRTDKREENLVQFFAALCHDLAKPMCTVYERDAWRSPRHEEEGGPLTKQFMNDIGAPQWLSARCVVLVKEHLKAYQLFHDKVGAATLRRLALRLAKGKSNLIELAYLSRADGAGRTSEKSKTEADEVCQWLCERAEELALEEAAPKPVVQGRDLIQRGYQAGPELGKLLKKCFDAQLDLGLNDVDEIIQHIHQADT